MTGDVNLLERWPGYDEQSWAERYAELDRRYTALLRDLPSIVEGVTVAWETRPPLPDTEAVRELVEALKPFADALDQWGDDPDQSDRRNLNRHPAAIGISLGELRRAHATFAKHRRAST